MRARASGAGRPPWSATGRPKTAKVARGALCAPAGYVTCGFWTQWLPSFKPNGLCCVSPGKRAVHNHGKSGESGLLELPMLPACNPHPPARMLE